MIGIATATLLGLSNLHPIWNCRLNAQRSRVGHDVGIGEIPIIGILDATNLRSRNAHTFGDVTLPRLGRDGDEEHRAARVVVADVAAVVFQLLALAFKWHRCGIIAEIAAERGSRRREPASFRTMHREFRRLFWPYRRPCSVAQSVATPVAKIGDVEYTDLHEAFEALKAGETVELIDDVDLNGVAWEPVNKSGIDVHVKGNNHIIKNLTINKEGVSNIGLFANLGANGEKAACVISDLVISNVTLRGNNYVGALAGSGPYKGLVTNVTVNGKIDIVATGSYDGVLVGHRQYASTVDCLVDGIDKDQSKIDGYAQVGGLFGLSGEGAMTTLNCTVKNLTVVSPRNICGGVQGRINYGNRIFNCSAENMIIKCIGVTNAVSGNATGVIWGGTVTGAQTSYVFNNTYSNVTVLNWEDEVVTPTPEYGAMVAGGNVVYSKNAVGDLTTNSGLKFNITEGDFDTFENAAALSSLTAQCAAGYAPIANEDGTYTIKQVWDVTFYVGDVVSNAQVVVNGECAQAFAYDTETIEAWTNATGDAFAFTTPITETTTLFAQLKATDPWADVEDKDVPGTTPENKAQVAEKLEAIAAALGATGDGKTTAVSTWINTVYGTGGVQAAKLLAATADQIALAVANDLPITANPTFEVETSEVTAANGVAAFEFALKDGDSDPIAIKAITDKVKAMVKYTGDLATTFRAAVENSEVSIAPADGKIKVELLKQTGVNAGFMKVEPNQPAK